MSPSIPAAVLEEMVRETIGEALEAVQNDSPGFDSEGLIRKLSCRLLGVLAKLDTAEWRKKARYAKSRHWFS